MYGPCRVYDDEKGNKNGQWQKVGTKCYQRFKTNSLIPVNTKLLRLWVEITRFYTAIKVGIFSFSILKVQYSLIVFASDWIPVYPDINIENERT